MLTHPPPEKSARIREITPRSVIVGLLVALVIGASYPYVVLKFGFGPNISVVSAFFGFMALGLFHRPADQCEHADRRHHRVNVPARCSRRLG